MTDKQFMEQLTRALEKLTEKDRHRLLDVALGMGLMQKAKLANQPHTPAKDEG